MYLSYVRTLAKSGILQGRPTADMFFDPVFVRRLRNSGARDAPKSAEKDSKCAADEGIEPKSSVHE